jgi:DNA-binding protein HU-beta
MTKAELIAMVADKAGLTRNAAEKAVGAITDSITTTLSDGDKVTLVGFGSFAPSERAARTGRNPRTGAEIQIPASKGVRFTAGAGLKKAIN